MWRILIAGASAPSGAAEASLSRSKIATPLPRAAITTGTSHSCMLALEPEDLGVEAPRALDVGDRDRDVVEPLVVEAGHRRHPLYSLADREARPDHRRRRLRRRQPRSRAGRAHPEWELVALDNLHRPRLGAQPPATRGGRGRVRARRRPRSRARLPELERIDALVECSAEPSALVGMSGDTVLPVRDQPGRRLQLPRARPPRRRPASSSSRPAASTPTARSRRAAARAGGDPLRARRPSRRSTGASPAGISESFPLDGARTLYGATKLAAELLIAEYAANFGLPHGDRPLRRDRRPVADGPRRPGRVHLLAAAPPFRAAAHLHRLRRRRASRCATCCTSTTWSSWSTSSSPSPSAGAASSATSAAAASVSLSLLETTELCRELTGHEVADRRLGRRAAGRRAALPLRLLAAVRARPTGGRARGARTVLADILGWVRRRTRPAWPQRSGSTGEALGRDPRPERGGLDRRRPCADRVERSSAAGIDHEILVVDDASIDGTVGGRRGGCRRAPAGPLPPLPTSARLRIRGSRRARPSSAATRSR